MTTGSTPGCSAGTARRGRRTTRCAGRSPRARSTRSGFPPRAARECAAVLRHRCTAGARGAARGGARRRGGHGPAPRQGGERRRARPRGRRVPAAVRRARRAVLAERPAGPGGGVRRRRRARGPGRHAGCARCARSWATRCWSGCRRTRRSSSTTRCRRRGGPAERRARCGRRRRRRADRRPGCRTCATPPSMAGDRPWFAIGGIDLGNVREVTQAGASRIVVVRAIRDADDPGAAASELRAALEESPVGAES